jgi:hypothetical protein
MRRTFKTVVVAPEIKNDFARIKSVDISTKGNNKLMGNRSAAKNIKNEAMEIKGDCKIWIWKNL